MQLYFLYIINKFVTIVICLLLAEPLKRVFLTLTIICRNTIETSNATSIKTINLGGNVPETLAFDMKHAQKSLFRLRKNNFQISHCIFAISLQSPIGKRSGLSFKQT